MARSTRWPASWPIGMPRIAFCVIEVMVEKRYPAMVSAQGAPAPRAHSAKAMPGCPEHCPAATWSL